MTRHVVRSYCRVCPNSCPTLAQVDNGRLTKVTGDPENDIWAGYTCAKGQEQPALHNHPDRLLHPLKRMQDGTFTQISVATALDEIAAKLGELINDHGSRSIAYYSGTANSLSTLNDTVFTSFMRAIGSKMRFSPNTIDKPGKGVALALHGKWMAPLQGYQSPDVALLIGTNPMKSYYGAASGNPGKWLRQQLNRGMQLIVIDPRVSDVARKATLHLRPRPGHDPAILACLLNIILLEDLYDHAFVSENAAGVATLIREVAPFTPEVVGRLADVEPDALRDIARRFAAPARGYAVCGVGPGFASSSTLVEYLVLILHTICGRWLRAGERVERTPTLLADPPYFAQACDPTSPIVPGLQMRICDHEVSVAGPPVGLLPEEMLRDGPGRVRALLSAGGNPVVAFPDQKTSVEGLRSLELLVQFDPWMSATAREAHYVIPPPMSYETAAMTTLTDQLILMPTFYGPAEAWAQWTPAVVTPPEGADVIPEWSFVYRLAQRLGLTLSINRDPLDMSHEPSEDELFERLTTRGRVSLADVKSHPAGQTYPHPARYVEPKQPGWTGRFDLGNEAMMADLRNELQHRDDGPADEFPLRLINIRVQNQFNSTLNDAATNRGRSHNPVWMHPSDMHSLGLHNGDVVEVASDRAEIRGIVAEDADLREGLVAMSFGYGGPPERDEEFREIGSSPSRLLTWSIFTDRHVAMPRIGNVPIRVRSLIQSMEPPGGDEKNDF